MSIKNTSKHEICIALAVLQKHQHHAEYIKTFINADGSQYRIENLSADVTCTHCKISIFIEGINKNSSSKIKKYLITDIMCNTWTDLL